jgi:hypothetical protein
MAEMKKENAARARKALLCLADVCLRAASRLAWARELSGDAPQALAFFIGIPVR